MRPSLHNLGHLLGRRALGLVGLAWLGGCGDEPTAPPHAQAPGPSAEDRPAEDRPAEDRPAEPKQARTKEGQTKEPERIGPYPRSQFVIAHDAFIAADDPKTVSADDARFLRDDDEVYGIVVAERARAYSTRMLSYHHVINDVMAGTPVAVTY